MPIIGLGVVTIAFFIGIFRAVAQYQYAWLIRAYLIFVGVELGLSIQTVANAFHYTVSLIPL